MVLHEHTDNRMPTQTRFRGGEQAGKSGVSTDGTGEQGVDLVMPGNASRSMNQNNNTPIRGSQAGQQRSPPPPPPSIEAQLADIRVMIRNLTASVDSCRDSLNKRVDSLETNIKTEIRKEIKQLQDYVDMNISQVVTRVEALEGKVEAFQQQQCENKEYDPEVTVVARGLNYQEDENVREKATDMLRRGLGLRDMPVVQAKRMRGYGNKPGIVKIELRSLEDKKKVFKE